MRYLLLAVLLSILAGLPVQAQPRDYERFQPTAEYQEACRLLNEGQRVEGRRRLLDIAARHPGTTLGARSLGQAAAHVDNNGDSRPILQQIIAGYPNSRFEIGARLDLLALDYGDRLAEWVVATDRLAQSFGGPALGDIIKDKNRAALVAQIRALPTEKRRGLRVVYRELHAGLANQLRRFDDALPLALFKREAFAAEGEGSGDLLYDLVNLTTGTWTGYRPNPPKDPTVTIKSPKPDQRKGPRPKIRVEITCGDWHQPQVDLAKLQFGLDQTDLKPLMKVTTKVNNKLKDDQVFERLRLVFRPSQALSPGTHTVSITVPVQGYRGTGPGQTRVTWSFVVSKPHDDPDDEKNDDEDD